MDTPRIVCVVDDDAPVRDSIQVLLESYGFAVRTFAAPKAFLAEFEPARTSCLLFDIHMPEMSGVELLEFVRARGVATPAIILTGRTDPTLEETARRAGAIAVLGKPVDDEKLVGLISQVSGAPDR